MSKVESNSRQLSCLTIGHSDLPVEAFVYYLHKIRVDCIIDVRSTPYSKYQPQYNREEISRVLKQENIEYRYMGDDLGGRYSDPALLFPDGTVNYQKVSETQKFMNGLNEVISLIESGKNIALMCSEKDPLRCHRYALIARNLQKKGINVTHLYPELIQKTNAALEAQILSGDNVAEQTLLNNIPEKLELAYLNLNKKIGYKIQPDHGYNKTQRPFCLTSPARDNDDKAEEIITLSVSKKEKKDRQKTLF